MLAVLVGISLISGQLGIWTLIGFIAGEATRFSGGEFGELTAAFALAILASWVFLAQLVVTGPQVARRLVAFRGSMAVLNGLMSAFFAAAFVELWTRLAMIALRPMFLWRDLDVPMRLVNFGEREAVHFGFTFHNLTWIALAFGLARWGLELLLTYLRPVSCEPPEPVPPVTPWTLQALLRSACFTFAIAGIFASVPGAIAFWLAIFCLLRLRRFASADPSVAHWDRLLSKTPAVIRLAAGYMAAFWIAQASVFLLRDMLGWRTMTTAAASIVLVMAAQLVLWPQTLPGEDPPRPSSWLGDLFRGASRAAPALVGAAFMFQAQRAWAHHCSFQPGCECLTAANSLALLVAAAVLIGLFLLDQTLLGVGWGLHDAISGRDLLTGERLSTFERVLAGLGAVPFLGAPIDAVRALRRSAHAGEAAIDGARSARGELGNAFNRAAGKEGFSTRQILGVKSTDEINAAMVKKGRTAAYQAGKTATHEQVGPGARFTMVISETDWRKFKAGRKPISGGWATTNYVPDQTFARKVLNIIRPMKDDVSRVVRIETTGVQEFYRGPVGALRGGIDGGAEQIEFLNGRNYRVVDSSVVLKKDLPKWFPNAP